MLGSKRFAVGRNGLRLTLVATLTAVLVAGQARAQDAKQQPKSSPVGGQWQTSQPNPAAVTGVTLDDKQINALKAVSAYFNQFEHLKGNFVQTNAEKQRLRGKFFVKRPGRLRFEYSLPSKQLIVSDGQQLAIQDLDLNTDDRIPLDQTPFRLLLRKDVDLIRDARISEVQVADDLVIVSLQDKSPDAPGLIRLFLSRAPEMELKEWVTTDAQGKDTRVEVSSIVKNETIDQAMFKIESPTFNKLKQ